MWAVKEGGQRGRPASAPVPLRALFLDQRPDGTKLRTWRESLANLPNSTQHTSGARGSVDDVIRWEGGAHVM